ncbi:hypothetical protein NOF04DRAFT_1310953, partial [Fusarium oxysporum II5]
VWPIDSDVGAVWTGWDSHRCSITGRGGWILGHRCLDNDGSRLTVNSLNSSNRHRGRNDIGSYMWSIHSDIGIIRTWRNGDRCSITGRGGWILGHRCLDNDGSRLTVNSLNSSNSHRCRDNVITRMRSIDRHVRVIGAWRNGDRRSITSCGRYSLRHRRLNDNGSWLTVRGRNGGDSDRRCNETSAGVWLKDRDITISSLSRSNFGG